MEARLEPTDSPAQAGPGWPPPGPGTVHQNRPGLPTPAAVPPRWCRGEKIASGRLGLSPGLSSYTKSETMEDGIKAA